MWYKSLIVRLKEITQTSDGVETYMVDAIQIQIQQNIWVE